MLVDIYRKKPEWKSLAKMWYRKACRVTERRSWAMEMPWSLKWKEGIQSGKIYLLNFLKDKRLLNCLERKCEMQIKEFWQENPTNQQGLMSGKKEWVLIRQGIYEKMGRRNLRRLGILFNFRGLIWRFTAGDQWARNQRWHLINSAPWKHEEMI